MTFFLEIMRLGLANLARHKLRSILTALGIILGVAAVITMVSIGEGSKRQALEQIERLGAKNIIFRSQRPPDNRSQQGGRMSFISKYGLERLDLKLLKENFPEAEAIVPLKECGGEVSKDDKRRLSQAFGTTPEFLEAARLSIARGRYLTQADMDERGAVGVIGHELAKMLFPFDDPLDSTVRVDAKAIRIVGVLKPVGLSGGAGAALVGRDLNFDLHLPITMVEESFGDVVIRASSGSRQGSATQVSEIYLGTPSREVVMQYAALAQRLIETRHPGMTDVTMIVPYELLENARRSAMTWNLVLGAIASISLLVGGIGIMNIMLASVTERTREIGIRRALGATRKHIVWQFLVETGVLSSLGGLVGVALGVGGSLLIGYVVPLLPKAPLIGGYFPRDVSLPTSITMWSIVVAFLVAAATGLVFGLYPARQAARQDPIVALRHD
ncbi:MAG: ABC transporter permease [Phycisphaerales bacterium]